jgi:hypothetical protein
LRPIEYKQYLNKEQSPAGKATMIEAPKFELFASISGGMFFIAPQLFCLVPDFSA